MSKDEKLMRELNYTLGKIRHIDSQNAQKVKKYLKSMVAKLQPPAKGKWGSLFGDTYSKVYSNKLKNGTTRIKLYGSTINPDLMKKKLQQAGYTVVSMKDERTRLETDNPYWYFDFVPQVTAYVKTEGA